MSGARLQVLFVNLRPNQNHTKCIKSAVFPTYKCGAKTVSAPIPFPRYAAPEHPTDKTACVPFAGRSSAPLVGGPVKPATAWKIGSARQGKRQSCPNNRQRAIQSALASRLRKYLRTQSPERSVQTLLMKNPQLCETMRGADTSNIARLETCGDPAFRPPDHKARKSTFL